MIPSMKWRRKHRIIVSLRFSFFKGFMFALMQGRFFFIYLLFLTAWLFDSSCANIIPPAGGPRDSIPPKVISVFPADSTLNFRSDRIEIEFDEYVDLQEVANNLLFTPLFEINPEVTVRNKNITVRFR